MSEAIARRNRLREALRVACLCFAIVYAAAHLVMLAWAVVMTLALLGEANPADAASNRLWVAMLGAFALAGALAVALPLRLLRHPARRRDLVLGAILGVGYGVAIALSAPPGAPPGDASTLGLALSMLRFSALIIFLPVAIAAHMALGPGGPFPDPTPLAFLYPLLLWIGVGLSLKRRPG